MLQVRASELERGAYGLHYIYRCCEMYIDFCVEAHGPFGALPEHRGTPHETNSA